MGGDDIHRTVKRFNATNHNKKKENINKNENKEWHFEKQQSTSLKEKVSNIRNFHDVLSAQHASH